MPYLLIGAIVAMAACRAVVAATAGLSDDEAYYRLWGLAPALSYLDHPPMTGWMIAASRWIAGDTALGIRLGAVAISLVGPFILWRTALILFDRRVAEWAVWVALAMPLLAVGGIIVTPDTPSVLFWGLTAWALAELHLSRDANWWLAVGLFSGLGLLSKYTNLFAGAGIVLWLVLLPANWRWFRSWQLWAGGIIAALCTLPVVVWNHAHDWASFAKQLGRVGRDAGFRPAYLLELIGGFIGLASPLIAILAVCGLFIAVRAAIKRRDQACALITAGSVPLLAYFLLHGLHARVQPNWLAPVYPTFAVCAALALSALRPATGRALGRAGVCIGLVISGLIYVHALHPLFAVAGARDPTSQTHGWPDLAAEIDRLREANGARWIATSSYATTGQLAFALAGCVSVVQLTERVRYAHLPQVGDELLRSPAIFVELERRQALPMLQARFGSVQSLGRITRRFHGAPIAAYEVYRLASPIDPFAARQGQ